MEGILSYFFKNIVLLKAFFTNFSIESFVILSILVFSKTKKQSFFYL